ncbi:MAG: sulfate adenylyltransferase subunit CysN [Nitriliruptoraceae bacterium]
MAHASSLIATDIEAYLAEHERKDLLRLLTCGSVDDGKSTLIGRLLHDSHLIYEDHLAALESDSVTSGTTGGLDLALLMDGLKAEREQGITIDVAWRYFSTARRKFIIADTPGHVQYTRNMVTGASNCQLAVLLVDARKGVQEQTRRHSFLVHLLGIGHLVVAVNKMDLVDWDEAAFRRIEADYLKFASRLGIDAAGVYVLPMSALTGDNVVDASTNMGWFDGLPLMEYLETVDVTAQVDVDTLRFPVQLVARPDHQFRGFAGTLASGSLRPGDPIVVATSGITTRVDRLVTFDGDLDVATPGMSVTVTLADEVDVSRGDLLIGPEHRLLRGHDVDAMVVWMSPQPASPGRQYLLQSVGGISNASIRTIHGVIDLAELDEVDRDRLELNDIARCSITVDRELLFDRYQDNPTTGSFILVDRMTNVTVGAGMLTGLTSGWERRPEAGLQAQPSHVTEAERSARLGQQPCTIVLTGMTGSGKSTTARALERRLFDRGKTALRLDGESLRLGISRDLGFTAAERSEHLRRAAEVAQLANQQGLIAIVAVQAPAADVRGRIRELIGPDRYLEIFLDAPEDVRRQRDQHGLYAAADRGDIEHLPGVTAPYEPPQHPDLHLDTATRSVEETVATIVELLSGRGFLNAGDGAP